MQQRIYINDDLTKKDQEEEKQLRYFAKEEKRKGQEVKIGYNKITVNGEEWRWYTVKVKLEEKSKN